MVRYGLNTQQLFLLQQQYAMMEHHLQLQQKSPTSPASQKDAELCRPRQINCVYFTEAKPAFSLGGMNPETAALCTISSNLPTLRSCVVAASSSSSPTLKMVSSGSAANSTPPSAPTGTTTRTSFMISDILDSPSSRSARNSSTTSSAPEETSSRSYGGYCEDPSNGRDSPRSVASDDVEGKERENREDSIGASDSDVERSGQAGGYAIGVVPSMCANNYSWQYLILFPSFSCRKLFGYAAWKKETAKSTVFSWTGV